MASSSKVTPQRAQPYVDPRTKESEFSEEEVAPYVRFDSYGAWGLKPQPLSERLRLLAMSLTLFPLKLIMTVVLMITTYTMCRIAYLFPPHIAAPLYRFSASNLCKLCLYCVGFRITWVRAEDAPGAPKPAACVSNHCSWSDIIIHMSDSFPSFVARDGTQDLPIVGFLSQKLGCMYVKRVKAEQGSQGPGLVTQITERMRLKASDPSNEDYLMMMFPEGTTTNGRYLLPFKTGVFVAGLPVRPYILKYSDKHRFYASWDTIDFFRQFWLLFCQPATNVTCYELPVYVPNDEEKKDAMLYASNVRNFMLKFGNMKECIYTSSESTYPIKMAYMKASKPK